MRADLQLTNMGGWTSTTYSGIQLGSVKRHVGSPSDSDFRLVVPWAAMSDRKPHYPTDALPRLTSSLSTYSQAHAAAAPQHRQHVWRSTTL